MHGRRESNWTTEAKLPPTGKGGVGGKQKKDWTKAQQNVRTCVCMAVMNGGHVMLRRVTSCHAVQRSVLFRAVLRCHVTHRQNQQVAANPDLNASNVACTRLSARSLQSKHRQCCTLG